jgi:uncharacterized membrane protein
MTRTLRRVTIALTGLGLADAIYLTYIHYAGIKPACTAGQSCLKVQTSEWSHVGSVPVALIGLIGYVAIMATLLAPDREETRLATLGMTLIGFGFSAYLTYRELFTIHAVCEWCAASAVILTLLLIASITRYLLGDGPPPGEPEPEPAPLPRKARAQDQLARPRA